MAIALRADFDATRLRAIARQSKDAAQTRRLLALAAIYHGATRTQAAELGGVTLQIMRDWLVRFNAEGPEGLVSRKAPGQPSKLNDAHRAALVQMLESGPVPAAHGVVRWRLVDLCQWIWEEFRISIAKQTLRPAEAIRHQAPVGHHCRRRKTEPGRHQNRRPVRCSPDQSTNPLTDRQPDPDGRSLATALSKARFASGLCRAPMAYFCSAKLAQNCSAVAKVDVIITYCLGSTWRRRPRRGFGRVKWR